MTINLLNDRYQVIRTLGAGGFGETYLAEDSYMPSKRRCVVKQLRPIQNNPQIYQLVKERFQREAAILEELGGASDQIPKLYAYFESGGQFYLVQEWIEGDTLTAKIQKQGLFSESAVQQLLVNLLPILEYVHSQHIVHRDIKPDNIILRHRDGKPVLIDFGAMRESMGTVVNSQGNPTSSIVIGTPGYMPSEQAAGRPVYSSDLYSLGLTAIYLLTGKQPQQLETDPQTADILWRKYARHVNSMIAESIDQAIAYHPRDRYPTAKAMLDSLQSITNTIPPTQVALAPPSSVTFAVAPHLSSQGNTQNKPNGIILGSFIAGGLIGASVIISQMLPKSSPPPATQPTIASQVEETQIQKSPTITSQVKQTPLTSSPPAQPPITKPQTIATPKLKSDTIIQSSKSPEFKSDTITQSSIPPIDTTTTNNYSWLSERSVSNADLDGKDGFELDIMRNSIFARYGRKFDTPGIQDYFNQQSWYRPRYLPKDFPTNLLSKLERQNVDYITKYQDAYNLRHFKK